MQIKISDSDSSVQGGYDEGNSSQQRMYDQGNDGQLGDDYFTQQLTINIANSINNENSKVINPLVPIWPYKYMELRKV